MNTLSPTPQSCSLLRSSHSMLVVSLSSIVRVTHFVRVITELYNFACKVVQVLKILCSSMKVNFLKTSTPVCRFRSIFLVCIPASTHAKDLLLQSLVPYLSSQAFETRKLYVLMKINFLKKSTPACRIRSVLFVCIPVSTHAKGLLLQ